MEGRVYLVLQMGHSLSWWQGHEAAGPSASTVRKQGAATAAAQLAFMPFNAPERCCRYAGWVSCLS